eukprot:3367687-Rhodomonas_salina.1
MICSKTDPKLETVTHHCIMITAISHGGIHPSKIRISPIAISGFMVLFNINNHDDDDRNREALSCFIWNREEPQTGFTLKAVITVVGSTVALRRLPTSHYRY